MRPSEAAIEAARTLIGEYYTAGKPSPAAMAEILQDVYGAQFGDETLYRIDYTRDKSDGAWVRTHTESLVRLGVLVPVEGGDDE